MRRRWVAGRQRFSDLWALTLQCGTLTEPWHVQIIVEGDSLQLLDGKEVEPMTRLFLQNWRVSILFAVLFRQGLRATPPLIPGILVFRLPPALGRTRSNAVRKSEAAHDFTRVLTVQDDVVTLAFSAAFPGTPPGRCCRRSD